MKILVPVKRAIDCNVKVRIKADGTGVDLANVKMPINPFDEISAEEAMRLKEAGIASEVVVVSIGDQKSTDTLRNTMAMSADRAILVTDDLATDVEPLAVAKILAKIIADKAPELVIVGKQAIDNDMNTTGQMLAALLGWAQATFASGLMIENGKATVTREVDGGMQTIDVALPAIVTTGLRLNETRYATRPNIMKAKKKPLEEKTPADYGVDTTPRLAVLATEEPAGRKAGIVVNSVDERVTRLKEGALV